MGSARHRALVVAITATLLAGLPAGAATATSPDHSPPTAPPHAAPTVALGMPPIPVSPACSPGFADIASDHRFVHEICRLADRGITEGYPDGTYRSTRPVSRQAMAAFLHRVEGAPTGPFPDPEFTDVPVDHPFHHEIAWLADAGIAEGFDDGTFGPDVPVSRQALAVLLHRLEGAPAGPFPDPGFIDVPADHPFHLEIAWLADAGIAIGDPDGGFGPGRAVSRQAVAAFLYRLDLVRTVDGSTTDRCEFLDPTRCVAIYPSDHLTVEDPTTDTGRRLALHIDSMPANKDGLRIDPSELNRNDGFSPGQQIVLRVPGVDLDTTGAPSLSDLGESLAPDAPIVLIDADTGQRHPFWAELDRPDLPMPDAERALMVLPAVNLEEGHRYVVALRDLRDTDGELLEAGPVFAAYRDEVVTGIPWLEARRPAMDNVLATLDAAGVGGGDLYLAWDFTVASERNLSERLLHIRDDAFADLGEAAPTFTVTTVEDLTPAQDPDIARRVSGTVEVPLYLTGAGEPGSAFSWGADGLPERNGTYTATWTCRIPHSATAATPARLSLYGHGLLGGQGEVNAGNVRDFAMEHDIVFCATDWIGMATPDIGNVLGILSDFSRFHTLTDRVQQGILNFLFLGRLMKHGDGLASHPAFHDGGAPLIDTTELFYDGNSQGGIIGGAATAVAQDWTRAVLGVPGMNYSTLLRRSSDWPALGDIMGTWYPNRFDQTLILAAGQAQWDRAEANGYAHHMTDDPYPGTPAHQVLLHVAYADHQVSIFAADVEARTIGARLRTPALADGRHPAIVPFWGLEPVPTEGGPFTGSAIVYWDSGTPAPPLGNQPPTEGEDPHEHPRRQAIARAQKSAFFDGMFLDVCGTAPCPAS